MINQLLTFGGEWRHDKLKDPVNLSSGSQSTSASQYALFLEDEWRIIEPLALTTGIRMDDHQTMAITGARALIWCITPPIP
ncbi:ferric iron-catecholate outer membrane transporter [Klebsiella grimontii]|uniref:Ferric iron-catecholate outer membrane transporter n=1 Tax=Klebsiella grimontii TaxID=2058152 RepID=A0A7H4NZZ4_9ENTR|nr:ferric iron-catecholate outer membrane transporter [Klebsiella grimontii]